MDGVLCDFEKAVVKTINRELSSKNPKHPKLAAKIVADLGRNYVTVEDIHKYSPGKSRPAAKYMYSLVHDDEDWWAKLPWMPDGKKLWDYISQYNPDILTSPMDKAGKKESLKGKLTWVKKNLGLDADKVNFAHDKYKFALSPDGRRNILIDDFTSKIDPWDDAGGIGILHINANNTIKILKLLEELDEVP